MSQRFMLITCIFALSALAPAVHAENNNYQTNVTQSEEPVITIRFNAANVYFQMPLYNVVKKALRIYPGAFFEVVSIIPTTGNFEEDEGATRVAHSNIKKVTNTLSDMGVPAGKYQVNYTTDSEAVHNEIQIFVR